MTATLTAPPAAPAPAEPPAAVPLATKVRRAPIPAAAVVYNMGHLLTAEELMRVPESVGKQELVDGRVIEMPPVGWGHGKRQGKAFRRLDEWNDAHGLGSVMVEVGFILDRAPDLVRGPDVAFIRTENIPADQDEDDFIEAVPDLAVEVKSKNDTMPELRAKAEEYLAFGVPLVWLVDRRRRVVEVYRLDYPPLTLGENDDLDDAGTGVLPGFACRVADVLG